MTNSDNSLYDSRLGYLLNAYVAQTISPEERAELFAKVADPENEPILAVIVEKIMRQPIESTADLSANSSQEIVQTILTSESVIEKPIRRVIPFYTRWWVAASLLFVIATAVFLLDNHNKQASREVVKKESVIQDIDPGKEGAILTLADGSQLVLDSLGNGVVTLQNGTQVVLQDGQLSYAPGANLSEDVAYNTITTPRGRQFILQLPDGTRVWLNASSSLTYPTAFTGAERQVDVSGEAFFEVAANVNKPFKVRINNRVNVDVLGTSFNVNAYSNESAIYATLVEGAVRVSMQSNGNKSLDRKVVLTPGQQAKVSYGASAATDLQASIDLVKNPDLNKIVAWKRGFFNLEDATLPEVMRMLERWYDIEVKYVGEVPVIQFGGEISKNMKLSGVLKALSEMEVNFTVEEGRRIVIHEKK